MASIRRASLILLFALIIVVNAARGG
jgi:DnaJ-class molecular chaperone